MKTKINLFAFAFLILSLVFSSLFAQQKNKKDSFNNRPRHNKNNTQTTTTPNAPQINGDNIKFKNSSGSSIITFTDEGSNNGSVTLPSMGSAPVITTNKLYNINGALNFNGSTLGSSSVSEIDDLSDGKTGGHSVYLGSDAGLLQSSGTENTGVGEKAHYTNAFGSKNTSFGFEALYSNQSGNGNIALGYKAGYSELGSNKLYIENSNSTSPLIWGDFSTDSIKINGSLNVTTKIITPHFQMADSVNNVKGFVLTSDDNFGNAIWTDLSTEFGAKKIDDLTDGKYNTQDQGLFLGNGAGANDLGYYQNEPRRNVGVGKDALYSNTSGSRNVGIGYGANFYNNTGNNNTVVGYAAGGGSGGTHAKSGNVFIGYKAGFNETGDGKLYISNSETNNPLIWGDFANDIAAINGKLGVGTQNPSDKVEIIADAGQDGLRVRIGTATKFRVFSNGGTSIGANNGGGTPANGLYVQGDIKNLGGVLHTSDRRFKKNIALIPNALENRRIPRKKFYGKQTNRCDCSRC